MNSDCLRDDVPTRRKAFAYIVHTGKIVLLHHPDHPEAGVQVPAGTMEPGEAPEDAVLREAFEETGLAGLRIVRLLGRERIDMRPWSRAEWHDRWFFVLAFDRPPDVAQTDAWERVEATPADGGPSVRFLLRWTPLAGVPPLIARHDRFLNEIVPGA